MKYCKVCNKKLNDSLNIYCSNKCKFKDSDYNSVRAKHISKSLKNKINDKSYECKICHKIYETNASGCCQKHLKNIHNIKDYNNLEKYYDRINYVKPKIEKKLKCPLCDKKWVNNLGGGLTTHLKKEHNLSIQEAILKFNYLKNHFNANERRIVDKILLKDNKIQCMICKKFMSKLTHKHLSKHRISKLEYENKYGKHSIFSVNSLERARKQNIYRKPKKESKYEKFVSQELNKQYKNVIEKKKLENHEFDICINNIYIEIDGIYWHVKDYNKLLSISQINNLINDYNKNEIIKKNKLTLYRLWTQPKLETITIDEIEKNSYMVIKNGKIIKNYYRDFNRIISKQYYNNLKPNNINLLHDLLTYFFQYYIEFPYQKSNEKIESVLNKIRNNPNLKLTSNLKIGNNFLKSRFKSFYHTKVKNFSAYDSYYNFEILKSIIINRLSSIYADYKFFTPKMILKGLSANYYLASFFNPKLAYLIYQKIAKPNDIILDMSCGFGGRLLGWAAFQNGGKYIGYEPNTKTYSELLNLKQELNLNIEIYNEPFEDANLKKVDICFSCPPYFNKEIYCNEKTQSLVKYKNIEEWKEKFLFKSIDKMIKISNKVYLVVDLNLKQILETQYKIKEIDEIKNLKSHFTKKNNYEYLIQI